MCSENKVHNVVDLRTYKQCAHNQWTNFEESSHQETSLET